MIAVDTSVLVSLFRGRNSVAVETLRALSDEGTPIGIPAVCVQEILQGARDEEEWGTLHDYLLTQHILTPLDPVLSHVEAARLYFEARRRGITVRSTVDCLIAQLVIELDGLLLHEDRDFDRLAEMSPLRVVKTTI